MCGIYGIVSNKQQDGFASLSTMAHRGPDDAGFFETTNLYLGQQRLAIQDLSANGHQPMLSEDGRFVLIFNGEIYNHWEIRASLVTSHTFKSSSDTETLLYAYIAYGVEVFNQLNGIFSLAIYDNQTGELVIARDPFGVKPLYLYQDDTCFAFASEIKAFTKIKSFEKTLDYAGILNYIHFLYSPAEKTPLKQVQKLLAGHYIKIKIQDWLAISEPIELTRYYDLPFTGIYSTKSEEELINELDDLLFKAVKRQLLADVPLGFFLSGGLDSSAVVAMARRAFPNKPLNCFTIDTGNSKGEGFEDDLHYAKLVAQHLNVELKIVEAKPNVIADFDKMIYHLDEPQADIAPLHVLNISKVAKQEGISVLLGGTGGDDLFSGYRRHQALAYESTIQRLPSWAKHGFKKLIALFSSHFGIVRRIQKATKNLDKSKVERMQGYFEWLDLEEGKALFKDTIQEKLKTYQPSQEWINALKNIPAEKNSLNQMLYWELHYFLTDHNLNYTDKLGMATGVEIRVPFLDKELVAFSTKIPPDLKLKGTTTKYLLKKVMERYLPKEVIYRSKTGFGVPLRLWLLHELKPFMEERLSKKALAEVGFWDEKKVWDLINRNQRGEIDATYSILALMGILSWHKQFIASTDTE